MIDLRSVIASLGGTVLTVQRRPPGIWTEGVYQPADQLDVVLGVCSVQPGLAKGMILPEGVRAEDVVTVYAPAELRGAEDPEGYSADRFVHRARRFEVFDVRDWTAGAQGIFFKASCRRVRDAEGDES